MDNISSKDNIIWVDMEMTGLDPENDLILEIGCVVTDKYLNIISDKFNMVINHSTSVLGSMNEWCLQHHSQSGLIKESMESNYSISDAEEKLIDFLQSTTPPGLCPLAGNTVYMDKIFLCKYMPRVAEHLHYRIIDVSSIAELKKRWYPNCQSPKKKLRHRAMPDIMESIKELKFYNKAIFRPAAETRNNSNTRHRND